MTILPAIWRKRLRRSRPVERRVPCRPTLEPLEDRTLLSGGMLASAVPLTFPPSDIAAVAGFLATPNAVDMYSVSLNSGDLLNLSVNAQASGSTLRSLLRVFDANGSQVALDDQEGGDPKLTFQAAATGVYYIGISSAPDDNYKPLVTGSGNQGVTTGLYTLNARLTTGTPSLPDLAGASFRLGTQASFWGGTLTGSFSVENRGGADAGAFDVQLLVSTSNLFEPAHTQVLQSFPLAGLAANGSFSSGQFTITLPDDTAAETNGLPAFGPVYLGLRIDPNGAVQEINPFDQSGIHRGADGESLLILRSQQNQVAGVLAAGQHESFTLHTVQDTEITATATTTSGDLVPRLSLLGPDGGLLIQSEDGTIVQQLPAGSYSMVVGSRSGAGSFQLIVQFNQANPPLAAIPVVPDPSSVVAADLTGDGIPDLVVASGNTYNDQISVLLGNGDGTFQQPQAITVGHGPCAVAVADLNGDGKLDLVVANYEDSTISILLGNGDGTFRPDPAEPNPIKVPNNPRTVAVADLTGDGIPDIIVADTGTDYTPGYAPGHTITVLLGQGNGKFVAEPDIPVGLHPRSLAVADLNGDGIPDIVVADTGTYYHPGDTVHVLIGRGDGTFYQEQAPLEVGVGPRFVTVADVYGDGKPDILVANFGQSLYNPGDTISILRNNGNGTFQPQQVLHTGQAPVSIAVADLNGDGQRDIAVGNGDGTVSVFLAAGNGSFLPQRTTATGSYPSSIAVADLSGDGKPDLIVTDGDGYRSYSGAVSILVGNGDGSFQARQAFDVGARPNAVAVADVNGDGKPDVITTNYRNGSVSVLLGNGDGTLQQQEIFPAGPAPFAVLVGDVNGDGRPDLVVWSRIGPASDPAGTIRILLGNGDGSFQPPEYVDAGTDIGDVALADVDGDGTLDLVVTNPAAGTVTVFPGNGNGTFQPPRTPFKAGPDPVALAVADVNGDGKPDLVVANSGFDEVSVLFGDGHGGFAKPLTSSVGINPNIMAVADLTGDGKPDLILCDYGSRDYYYYDPGNTLKVLLGNGSGTFQQSQTLTIGSFPRSLAVQDLNHDGIPDIVVASMGIPSEGGGSLSVLYGEGGGLFANPVKIADPSVPIGVAIADLNGSGQQDLIACNGLDNTVSVLLGNGDGSFTATTPANGGDAVNTPAFVDLDGDGIPDSVILNRSGDILFRKGLGDNQFAPPVVLNPGHPARDLAMVNIGTGWAIAAADTHYDRAFSSQGDFVYDISVYTLAANDTVTRTTAFTTSYLPTRITAADLTDPAGTNGLDDLIVANTLDNTATNSLDNTITVAFQVAPGRFGAPVTLPVGIAPSDIVCADVNGDGLLDIVVSDEASGDVTVLLNDATHSFATSERFRASTGLYSLTTTGASAAVTSLAEPVSLVAGDFTGNGLNDLVVVNRGSDSFTTLVNDGSGGFYDPTPALTTSTSDGLQINDQPGPVVAGDFARNGKLDLAILMENRDQVWIYTGNGDGTFEHTASYDAGNSPTGLALVPGSAPGLLDLLIGNQFGDVLRLRGNGDGTFQPFQRIDPSKALALVGSHIIVSNHSQDQLTVQNGLTGAVSVVQDRSNGLQAPGSVQVVNTGGDKYLVVANSGANEILVYPIINGQPDPAGEQKFATGTDPQGITVADLTGSGSPDLIVANEGSNDVSVFFGKGTGADWTLTYGPRLVSGGAGPTSTVVEDVTGPDGKPDGIPDLVVCNSQSNSITVLPGVGGGFFNDQNPLAVPVGAQPVEILAVDQGVVAVNFGSNDLTLIPNFADPAVHITLSSGGVGPVAAVMDEVNGISDLVVANEDDGHVALLLGDGESFGPPQLLNSSDLALHPTALALSPLGNAVFVADRASEAIASFDLQLGGPAAASFVPDETASLTAFPFSLTGGSVAFVATLLTTTGAGPAARSSTGSVGARRDTAGELVLFSADPADEGAPDSRDAGQQPPSTVGNALFNFLSGVGEPDSARPAPAAPTAPAAPAAPPAANQPRSNSPASNDDDLPEAPEETHRSTERAALPGDAEHATLVAAVFARQAERAEPWTGLAVLVAGLAWNVRARRTESQTKRSVTVQERLARQTAMR